MSGLIVLEGLDATGKTSVGKMLVERLQQNGVNAMYHKTRHTCLTKILPFGPAYLVDYLIDERRIIRPSMGNSLLIQDRYYYTVMAYNAALTNSRRLHVAISCFSRPDIVFYFSADDKIREQRWILSGRQGFSEVFRRPGLAAKMDYEYRRLLPEGTVYVDTTHYTVDQVVDIVINRIESIKNLIPSSQKF